MEENRKNKTIKILVKLIFAILLVEILITVRYRTQGKEGKGYDI